ncbi:MAG: hypothetical protein AAF383_25585 [Cyanobacteria bacterium P01_A01_bin.83]
MQRVAEVSSVVATASRHGQRYVSFIGENLSRSLKAAEGEGREAINIMSC